MITTLTLNKSKIVSGHGDGEGYGKRDGNGENRHISNGFGDGWKHGMGTGQGFGGGQGIDLILDETILCGDAFAAALQATAYNHRTNLG